MITRNDELLPAALPGFDLRSALGRVMGDRRLLRSLLVQFGVDSGDAIARLRAGIAAGHFDDADRGAHLLKGVAGNLGASAVAAAAQGLLAALRTDNRETLPALLDRLEQELTVVLNSCSGLTAPTARDEPDHAASPLSAAELEALFDELTTLLRSNNTRAGERASVLSRALAGSPQAGRCQEMLEAIGRFGFKRALIILQELRTGVRMQYDQSPTECPAGDGAAITDRER